MFFTSIVFITSLLLSGSLDKVFSTNDPRRNFCSTISLIHVFPSSQNEEIAGWDERELNLHHRAELLAVEYINNSSDLLPGIRLDIVDVSTDDCVRQGPLQDLVEVFKQIYETRCVFGVVGLYCSRVTLVIAAHLSHPNFGYVQLSSSTSPLLLNHERYPHLFRMISSSSLFNKAVVKMMDEFNWKNISLIYDFSDVFFRSTAINFAVQVLNRIDLNILAFFPIRVSGKHEILEDVAKMESRVIYFSVTHKESSDILCDAYYHKYFWPDYASIFVDDSLEDILANDDKCTKDQLLQAAEGIILLLNRQSNSKNANHSGINYEQYRRQLRNLSEYDSDSRILGVMQYYADVLYDQIWAFAFAINNSLSKIQTNMNGSFEDNVKHSPHIRNILAQELKNISFQGASGNIQFNENQAVLTMIDIIQVRNKTQVIIGEYDPHTESLTFNNNFNRDKIPDGSFEIRHDAIPQWLGVLVALSQGFLLVLFVITIVHIVHLRNTPEVKSTSLCVSILILSGCLMVILSSLFYNLENFSNASASSITAFCNLESWLFLYGINLILVALFFRLLRVFIIFHYPKTKMRLLTDVHLLAYISITSLIPILFLVIWTAADHLHQVARKIFLFSGYDPHYTEHFYCSSTYTGVWTGLYYSWICVLIVVLLVLAIQTRHIKYNDFKDTKKMGAFLFLVSLMLGTFVPLSYLLQTAVPVASYIFKSLLTLVIPLACLALQYFPKLFPVLSQRKTSYFTSSLSIKTSKQNPRIVES